MPSIFSHSIAALAMGKVYKRNNPLTWKFCLLSIFCASIPDADVIAFHFNIPYSSLFGHRGITHSIFFSLLLGFLVVLVAYRKIKPFSKEWAILGFYFSFVTMSHALLDALTSGGLGVALFAPFEQSRYFFPFRPIKVSPIGIQQFFSEWGWKVLKSEFIWIWIPSALVFLMVKLFPKK